MVKTAIKTYEKRNVYDITKSWFSTMDLYGKDCLDLGCSVGGIAKLAAERGGHAYGLDMDYYSVFTASRVLKHVPDALDRFRIEEQGRQRRNSIIRIKKIAALIFCWHSA